MELMQFGTSKTSRDLKTQNAIIRIMTVRAAIEMFGQHYLLSGTKLSSNSMGPTKGPNY